MASGETWLTMKYVSIRLIQSLIVRFVSRSHRSTSHLMLFRNRPLEAFRDSLSIRNRPFPLASIACQDFFQGQGQEIFDSVLLHLRFFLSCESYFRAVVELEVATLKLAPVVPSACPCLPSAAYLRLQTMVFKAMSHTSTLSKVGVLGRVGFVQKVQQTG